jgi:nitrogen fixation/metabolism regulation signal transduction histidine kinase
MGSWQNTNGKVVTMASKKSAKSNTRKVGEIVLRQDAEIPARTRRAAASPVTQAIRNMKVGESFTVPAEKSRTVRATLAREKKIRDDFNYVTRKVDDGNIGIWRVEA